MHRTMIKLLTVMKINKLLDTTTKIEINDAF